MSAPLFGPPRPSPLAVLPACAAFALATSFASSALGAPPGYCRPLRYSPARQEVARPVFVATSGPGDGVTVDGSNAVPGPVLVVRLAAGKHRIAVTSASGAVISSSFDVDVGPSARVVRGGRSASRPQPFRLSLAYASRVGAGGEPAATASSRPRLVAAPIRADDLARYHCDPALHPHLPPVSSLLASTEAACNRDEPSACAIAAEQWFSEVGVRPRDPVQGVARLERACRLGVGESCVLLARLVAIGNGARVDPTRAAEILDASCSKGHGGSCAARAWMHLPDGATLADRALAVPLMERACELDPAYCGPAREQRLKLSCGRGDHEACELLDPEHALRAARQAAGADAAP